MPQPNDIHFNENDAPREENQLANEETVSVWDFFEWLGQAQSSLGGAGPNNNSKILSSAPGLRNSTN